MQVARGDRRKSAIGNRCWGLKPVAGRRRRGQAGEHSLAPLSHSYDRPRRGRVMHIDSRCIKRIDKLYTTNHREWDADDTDWRGLFKRKTGRLGSGGVQEALRTRNCESGIANGEVPADGTVGDGGRETGDGVSGPRGDFSSDSSQIHPPEK